MNRRKRVLGASFALLVVSSSAWGLDVQTRSEDFALEIMPEVQPRIEVNFDGPEGTAAPSGHANVDIYLRRARLIVRGTAYKRFTFGLVIAALRIGERGNFNVSPFVQAVRIGYVPTQDVHVEMGLLLMPLTRAALASYPSGIEGAGNILLYNNARTLHETGIQVRALLLNRRMLVRGGLYEGARNTSPAAVPPVNPNGLPVVAGMLRLNLVGEEAGYLYPSIYLDDRTRVSIGVGGQYQQQSGGLRTGASAYDDYVALAADLFADVAFAPDREAILMAGGYRFNYGPGNAKTGYGAHGEIGYRWGPLEPQANFYWFNSDTKENSYLRIAGGLNVFLHGHRGKIQIEFARAITNANLATTPPSHQFIIQPQFAF
jgi:hypothetical protein